MPCRHVAGEAADEARVRADLAQRRPQLVGVQVDADTAEDCDVDGFGRRHAAIFAWTKQREPGPCAAEGPGS